MSRLPLHALTWSPERGLYELCTRGQLQQRFGPTDEAAWQAWLDEATSFAFHGETGSLNVYQEARPRGGAYWYAYHTSKRRTRKRYLGSSAQLTFDRLEETAQARARAPASRAFCVAPAVISRRALASFQQTHSSAAAARPREAGTLALGAR